MLKILHHIRQLWKILALMYYVSWASACSPPWERGIGDDCETPEPHRDTSCAEGVCLYHVCRLYVTHGEACDVNPQCIDEGDLCVAKDVTQPNVTRCLPPLKEGDSCVPGRETDCSWKDGLNCYQGKCTAPKRLGEECLIKFPNGPPSCRDGLICRPRAMSEFPLDYNGLDILIGESGVCDQPIQEGETCQEELGVYCELGFICRNNVCTP